MNEHLLEPLKGYDSHFRAQHAQNTADYFQDLLRQSRVDVEQNRATVKKYDAERATIERIQKRISKYKVFRVLLIIACVLGGILLLFGACSFSADVGAALLLVFVGGAIFAGGLLLILKKINPVIKDSNVLLQKHNERANALYEEAMAQMAPLNALFDEGDTFRLIERTIPEFDFEPRFTERAERAFVDHCDFVDRMGEQDSVLDTVSGHFCENPFLFYRHRSQRMGLHTYHGSLTIHWTETYRDSKGNRHTRHRSQVLTASVTKPKPEYSTHTALVYGCQAAPDLHFSRKAAHTERLSERELERKIRSGEKDLLERAEQSTVEGGDFREMTNTEFDVLFGALDRDNEVQFRVMFTPLAQNNTVDLLRNTSGFGDDFSFYKQGRLNHIVSEHAQTWHMNTSPHHYISHSVDLAEQNFKGFNEAFFKSFYFDFAPLMSVPAYMEEPCYSLREPYADARNYTRYEHEALANKLGHRNFAPHGSATESILKTAFWEKRGGVDCVTVTAHSFAAYDRVDFVPMMGGDGRMHSVPVPWVEYLPIRRDTEIEITDASAQQPIDRESQKAARLHGLLAYLLD
ncbi:MAG: hypothetical protein E7666_03995 [Ruminococcaceae bacterium]|nr:hypothetical protein [Oscillospiraceae bacterium]